MRQVLCAVLCLVVCELSASAADQHVLGNRLVVVDPGMPTGRRVILRARESSSDDVLVGDPLASGATIGIDLAGDHPSTQVFSLPPATSPTSLEPFWRRDVGRGFTYRDRRGENGPVKFAQIRTTSRSFQIKALIDGRLGAVALAPPYEGTGACALFTIGDGDSYSVAFLDGTMTNNGPYKFKATRPTQQRSCATSTSTTTSTTTSTVPRPVVWLFGDSITGLYCQPVQAAHPEWELRCAGVGAERTADGLPRLRDLLSTATSPAVVLIEEGVNDAAAAAVAHTVTSGTLTCNVTPPLWIDDTLANLDDMRTAIRDAGGVPIVASMLYLCPVPSEDSCMALPPDDPSGCPDLRCFFDDACALNAGITGGFDPWVDFVLPSGDYFRDLLHPNEIGIAYLVGQATAAIQSQLP